VNASPILISPSTVAVEEERRARSLAAPVTSARRELRDVQTHRQVRRSQGGGCQTTSCQAYLLTALSTEEWLSPESPKLSLLTALSTEGWLSPALPFS
jgi:hypothetical protein